jgi:hypothetical protein
MVKLVKVKIYRNCRFLLTIFTWTNRIFIQPPSRNRALSKPVLALRHARLPGMGWKKIVKHCCGPAHDWSMFRNWSLPVVKGASSNPSINQPTNGNLGHLWNHRELSQLWSTRV